MTWFYRFTTLPLVFVLPFLSACGTPRPVTEGDVEPPTTIILIRHAEKDYGAHPHLTEAGRERAERLVFILENEDIAAIYSTPTFRTLETAEPLAEAKGLTVKKYDSRALKGLARRLIRKYRGRTVVVSGHSNTTPALTNYLTGTEDHPRFSELDYTNLYVVTVPAVGPATVTKLRY